MGCRNTDLILHSPGGGKKRGGRGGATRENTAKIGLVEQLYDAKVVVVVGGGGNLYPGNSYPLF